jgi:hypothetical protein
MKKILKRYFPWIISIRNLLSLFIHPRLLSDFYKFRKKSNGSYFKPKFSDISPYLKDKTPTTQFDTHYVYHPAWAARIIKGINPSKHIDISSTLHFCTMLSAFIPTEFYDYRPAKLNLSSLSSSSADLCNLYFQDNSIESLSCMHTVEHIGLGRYGDPIDPEGDIKAIKELQRVVKPGGNFLFVTPVGKSRLLFNAHRIYSYERVIDLFDKMELKEFSLIPDNALDIGLISHADPHLANCQDYACGCFWFQKTDC